MKNRAQMTPEWFLKTLRKSTLIPLISKSTWHRLFWDLNIPHLDKFYQNCLNPFILTTIQFQRGFSNFTMGLRKALSKYSFEPIIIVITTEKPLFIVQFSNYKNFWEIQLIGKFPMIIMTRPWKPFLCAIFLILLKVSFLLIW